MLNRSWLLTFASLLLVAVVVGTVGGGLLLKEAEKTYVSLLSRGDQLLASSFAELLEVQLESGIAKSDLLLAVSTTLSRMPRSNEGFLCILDENGQVLCHPDESKEGNTIQGSFATLDRKEVVDAAQQLANPSKNPLWLEHAGRTMIVYQVPVENTDWIVSVHTRPEVITRQLSTFRYQLAQIGLSSLALFVVVGTLAVRLVGRGYEKQLEHLNADLENRVQQRTAQLEKSLARAQSLQSELHQARKMEALGRLSGSIAHDFGNLLTPMVGYSQLLARSKRIDDSDRELVDELLFALERARKLVKELGSFSRKKQFNPEIVDLAQVVKRLEGLMTQLVGSDIALKTEYEPSLAKVAVDPAALEQVLLNLVANARDATPSGGEIVVRVQASTDRRVEVSVSDTGSGIEPEVIETIFEPFFTTKGEGKGTGLGLATVHSIVTQYGGEIKVSSRLTEGTTFQIRFPEVSQESGSLNGLSLQSIQALSAAR